MIKIENAKGEAIQGIELGYPRELYPQYNISESYLYFKINGELHKSNRKFILLRNTAIADVSSRYKVIPSQEVEKITNTIASENGFTLFKKSDNEIFTTWKYLSEKPEYVITDNESEIRLGFQVRNSIDGSSGLSIDGFTFRRICTNGAIFGLKHLGLSANKKHTLNLTLDKLQNQLIPIVQILTQIKTIYQNWQKEFISEINVKSLLKIPIKYLPDSYFTHEHGKEIQVNSAIYNTTKYDIYNLITYNLSHTEKELEPRTELMYNYLLHTALKQ